MRSLLAFVLLSTGLSHAAEFTPAARKFLDQHCAECHDADVQKGNLRLDQLSLAKPDRRTPSDPGPSAGREPRG